MSDNENNNTQIATEQQPVATPESTGPTKEELQAQIDELKRQSEGRLRDLQQERQKRQEIEARASTVTPVRAAAQPMDEVDQLVTPSVERVVSKKMEEVYYQDKAWSFLESKTGKTRDQLKADPEFVGRFENTIKKFGVVKDNVHDQTVAAYELMELEGLKMKSAEKARKASIEEKQPLSGGNPAPTSSAKTFEVEDIKRMPVSEWDKLSATGVFKKVDGKFVYTPHK